MTKVFFYVYLGKRLRDEYKKNCDIIINNMTKLKEIMEEDEALENTTETGIVVAFFFINRTTFYYAC